jgi:ABC-2 type transport system ATP-binding protein
VDARRKAELLDRFQLDPTKKARAYSKGNRQKVALIAALASDVELLVLDEPTAGLDPLMELEFQRCVQEAAATGVTVLLSSHILAEVEKLCDRLTIIRAGRAVQTGTLTELRHLTRSTVTVVCREDAGAVAAAVPGVHDVQRDGDRVRFTVEDRALSPLMARLAPLDIQNLVVAPPTLEEVFVRQYGSRSAADPAGALP